MVAASPMAVAGVMTAVGGCKQPNARLSRSAFEPHTELEFFDQVTHDGARRVQAYASA
jgi:hypothetical protein